PIIHRRKPFSKCFCCDIFWNRKIIHDCFHVWSRFGRLIFPNATFLCIKDGFVPIARILGVSSELGKNCGKFGFCLLGSAIIFSCTTELYCLDVSSNVFPFRTTSKFVCLAYFFRPGILLCSGAMHSAEIAFSLLTQMPESVLTTRE